MSSSRLIAASYLAIALYLTLTGCGGGASSGSGTTPPPASATVTSVTVSCSPTSVQTGQTSQCSATVAGTGAFDSSVTWSVNSVAGGNSTVGTISASGLYTAGLTAPGSGTIAVSATSKANLSKSGSASLTLTYPVPTVSQISPVTVPVGSGATTITVNGTGFSPATTVIFNTSGLPTNYLSTTQVTAVISQTGETNIGKFSVTASNPSPGGGASTTSAEFDVTGGVLNVSVIDLPTGTAGNAVLAGAAGFTLPIAQTTSLQLPAGSYTLTANSVSAGGATYYAVVPTQSIVLADSSTNMIAVDYKNVVPSTTKTLDAAALSTLAVSSDGTTLTMSASSPVAQSLVAGDVVIVPPTSAGGATPMGLLRKVVSISDTNSQIVAVTQQATLADAFQRLSFQIRSQLTSQAIQSVHPASGVRFRPGISLRRAAQGTRLQSDSASLPDPCGGFSLGVFDVSKPIDSDIVPGLTLSGQVELCSGLNFSIDITGHGFLGLQPQLNALTATATMGEYSDLTLNGTFLAGSFSPDPLTLGTIEFPPIEVPGLPVWVTPEVSVFVGAKGDLATGFSTETSSSGTFSGGVSWTSGTWTPIQPAPSLQFAYEPPTLDASLSAKAFAGIKFDLYVYSIVGPSFKPDGYLAFNADISQNPWWTLTGGLEGPMSLDVTVLGENLASYELGTMFDYSKLIAAAPGPFSSSASAPVIQSLSPQQVTAGASDFGLTIFGANFVPGAVANFGSTPLATTWQSASQLSTSVPSGLVSAPGAVPVTVTNPGGGASTSANFTIASGSGKVTISPASVSVPEGGLQTFFASVSGGSAVNWAIQEGAAGGTIGSTGIYTAPSTSGTFHVVATNAADSSQSATAIVNVVTGPSIATLHSFDHSKEGANPWAPLIRGSDANFYGTTNEGGFLSCHGATANSGCGTVFRMDALGNTTVLHSFTGSPDGAFPVAALVQAADTNFYGTALYGGANLNACALGGTTTPFGCGAIFRVDLSGNLVDLYSFSAFSTPQGVGPAAPLIQATDHKLYGDSIVGGGNACQGFLGSNAATGCGSIFSLDTSGNLGALHPFAGSEGAYPAAALVQATDGDFYGVAEGGGVQSCSSFATPGCGTVFRMTADGTVVALHSFTTRDGALPNGALIQAADGNFYGTTVFGGNSPCTGGAQWQGCGVIFKIDSAGNFSVLHSFSGIDGAYPNAALFQANDGNFYGTTQGGGDSACAGRYGPGCGTAFKMDSSGSVTVLYSFTGGTDGSWPESALIQGTDGNLYGTTVYGGTADDGVVFRISNIGSLTLGAHVEMRTSGDLQKRPNAVVTPIKRPHVAPVTPELPTEP